VCVLPFCDRPGAQVPEGGFRALVQALGPTIRSKGGRIIKADVKEIVLDPSRSTAIGVKLAETEDVIR
jgi:phytoene dehydrogenase-like protein